MVCAATVLHFASAGFVFGAALHDGDVDAALREVHRRRQPDGAGADDGYLGVHVVARQPTSGRECCEPTAGRGRRCPQGASVREALNKSDCLP